MQQKKKILIADDHAIVRSGLKQMIRDAHPFSEIIEVDNADDMLDKVSEKSLSLIITDISMPGSSTLSVVKQIRNINKDLPILVLSVHTEEQYAIRAFKAGASGYLNKEVAPSELIKAVNVVLAGKRYVTPSIAEHLLAALHNDHQSLHATLSERECEVFKFLASGKSLSEIAQMLSLSVNTISTFRSRIMKKLGITSNAALIQYAMDNQLS